MFGLNWFDVVSLTAEQLADADRIRDLAAPPPLTIKGTWHETMIASREAVLAWEVQQDRMAVAGGDVIFEPWYVLGQLKSKDEHEWGAVVKDKEGKVLFDITGTVTRAKPPRRNIDEP